MQQRNSYPDHEGERLSACRGGRAVQLSTHSFHRALNQAVESITCRENSAHKLLFDRDEALGLPS